MQHLVALTPLMASDELPAVAVQPARGCLTITSSGKFAFAWKSYPDADTTTGSGRVAAAMISLPSGTRIWLAAGMTDMRRGFDGLASIVQEKLAADPFAGHVFVFRGRRGDLVKLLWWG